MNCCDMCGDEKNIAVMMFLIFTKSYHLLRALILFHSFVFALQSAGLYNAAINAFREALLSAS